MNYNKITNIKHFSTSRNLLSPNKKDSPDVIEKSRIIEDKFNAADDRLCDYMKDLRSLEEDIKDSESESELSKFIKAKSKKKETYISSMQEKGDEEIYNNRLAEDRLVSLEMVKNTSSSVIRHLKKIIKEIPDDDAATHHESEELLKEFKSLKSESRKLTKEFEENKLPPISENRHETGASNNSSSFPQDSKDVAQTDFSSFDPFDE